MGAIAKRSVGIAFLVFWVMRAIAFWVLWVMCDRISDVVGFECDRISDVVGLRAIASTKNSIILLFSRIILMEIQELKAIIKESIREVLREERMLLCQVLIPYVSDEEQEELDEMFGSPSNYQDEELVDMTEWVKNGHKIS
jgi:hypothetical protein